MRRLTKSISWRLQFWHATILLCVVAGLSTAWFLQTRRALLSEVDADLLSAARVLDGSLRGFRFSGSDRAASPPLALSPSSHRLLSLPRNIVEASDGTASPYFAIWVRDGRLLKSERLPQSIAPEYDETLDGERASVVQLARSREVRIVGPAGSQILVGRDVSQEFESLRRLAAQIVAISIGILTVGFIGGWWLSRSVFRPIHAMCRTASQFSVIDMSPRIDVVETDSELGELANILNDAFDRVQSSFAQQQQFAADASHELRTPLAVIQSQVELALRKQRAPEEYVKALTACAGAGERLSELVESLLTLARLDSVEQRTDRCPVRLDLIAAKCTDLMRPVAEHAEVNLYAKVTPASILGNPQQLECAILNLIKNGVAYNRCGGSVHVLVDATELAVTLTIRDTGIGISKQDTAHVTKRFFRVDKARTRQQHGGSGLGLSIADRIIESHGGSMQISSETGKGTTVTIEIALDHET